MATIEDKIKLFSKIVNERIHDEKQKDFDKFEAEKNEIINKKKQALEEKRQEILHDVSKKVQLKYNEAISKEKMENQSAVLELKKKFIENSISEVKSKLIEFRNSKEYGDFLISITRKTLKNIEAGDYIILISEEDMNNYGELLQKELENFNYSNFTIEKTDEDIIGGIIVQSRSGKYRINASFALKLEECGEIAGVKISEKIG